MSRNTPRKISKAEVRRSIDDGIKANDVIRLAGMENLLRFRGGKGKSQQREHKRLTEKYGDGHSRVAQLQSQLYANVNYLGGLRMEITRAKAPTIKPEAGSWCVQGYVYDRQGCPIPNAKVALFGAAGKEVSMVKASSTDLKGYYRLDYTPRDGTSGAGQILDSAAESELATAAGGTGAAPVAGAGAAGGTGAAAAAGAGVSGGAEDTQRLGSGLRINTNQNALASVFVRANDPQDPELCVDSTLITPRTGICSYRDLSLDTNAYKPAPGKDPRSTRYLGNSATRELHDLKNETARCQIDAIRFDHCVPFNTQKEAIAADYDFCAYCFGKDKSKR